MKNLLSIILLYRKEDIISHQIDDNLKAGSSTHLLVTSPHRSIKSFNESDDIQKLLDELENDDADSEAINKKIDKMCRNHNDSDESESDMKIEEIVCDSPKKVSVNFDDMIIPTRRRIVHERSPRRRNNATVDIHASDSDSDKSIMPDHFPMELGIAVETRYVENEEEEDDDDLLDKQEIMFNHSSHIAGMHNNTISYLETDIMGDEEIGTKGITRSNSNLTIIESNENGIKEVYSSPISERNKTIMMKCDGDYDIITFEPLSSCRLNPVSPKKDNDQITILETKSSSLLSECYEDNKLKISKLTTQSVQIIDSTLSDGNVSSSTFYMECYCHPNNRLTDKTNRIRSMDNIKFKW